MRFSTITAVAAAAAGATTASAKTIKIDVGEDGLTFSPNVTKADMGDTLEFHFYPPKHSVVLGDKDKACEPSSSSDMFFSGFMQATSGEASDTFQVTVSSTDPWYIYCSYDEHCQSGMVGVINGDEAGLQAYAEAAAKASQSVSPNSVTGGKIVSASSSSESSSGSGSASESATSSAEASGSSASATSSESAASSSGESSSTASSTPLATSKPAAAPAGIKGSVAGVLAAAGGVAALML